MSQHTQWKIDSLVTNAQTCIRTENGGLVCTMEGGNQEARDRHAKTIVRAVNCHADLLAALKLIVNCQNYCMGSKVSYEFQAALTEVEIVLRRAEEGG